MSGATAAWLIHNTTGCHVTVYEAGNVVGGRLKETEVDGRIVELGGSIGIEGNRYFVDTTNLLGLKRVPQPQTSAGIWDGQDFVFKSSDSLFAKFIRYGISPFLAYPIVQDAVQKFNKVYDLQAAGFAFHTAEELWHALGLAQLMNVTLHHHLRESSRFLGLPLINEHFITEVAGASTRVNYNQDPSAINALAGMIAMAPGDDTFTVDGGTGQMPAGLLKLANADVKLLHRVSTIRRSGSSWQVIAGGSDGAGDRMSGCGAAGGGPTECGDAGLQQDVLGSGGDNAAVGRWWPEKYDAVIIATPLKSSGITLEGLDPEGGAGSDGDTPPSAPGHSIAYRTVFTTYVKAQLRREFFTKACDSDAGAAAGCASDEELPGFIGTAEGSDSGFTCIGTLNASLDGNGTRLMKLFSTTKLPQELLERMFVSPEVPAEQRWKAYPVFRVPEAEVGRMRIAAGLYYVNALEAGASCIEVAAVAARNAVMLLQQDMARGHVADASREAAGGISVQQEL